MEFFLKRLKQYSDWVEKEEPAVMWLSGLHIPESYLTALVQASCKIKHWALDKSTLYTTVLKTFNLNEFKKKPEHGCYITGLYLEGAGWDTDKGRLRRQNPKELIFEMPIMQIIPIEANKLKLKGNFFVGNLVLNFINRFFENSSVRNTSQKECYGCWYGV